MLPTDAFICWAVIWALQNGLTPGEDLTLADFAETHGKPGFTSFGLYHCYGGDCGCLFFPDVNGDTVYVDRYEPADGCETERTVFEGKPCNCHKLPHHDPAAEETQA